MKTMRQLLLTALISCLVMLAAGCATDAAPTDGGTGERSDAGGDAATYVDGGSDTDQVTEELCDNAIDDDQDGMVDEGCLCITGETRDCYGGDPALAGIGACVQGQQTCETRGSDETFWGECTGWSGPSTEVCGDKVDNDCDGESDEDCGGGECTDGETDACYSGPEGTDGVGGCAAGQRTCSDGAWDECQGESTPAEEVSNDGIDNDCDGAVDENVFSSVQLSGGHWHMCGLDNAGEAYCWGNNRDWQLGDSTSTDRSQPTPVDTTLTFDEITSGYFFTCGLSNGIAYCWGDNDSGQLGTGDTSDRGTPTPVDTSLIFQTLAAGREHACGLAEGGTIYCWGANDNAQVGAGTTYPTQLTPRAIEGNLTFVDIAAGQLHTCGLTVGGDIYCWGYSGHGQIGNGTTEPFAMEPAKVTSNRKFSSITSGYRHNCAIADNDNTYCWGRNSAGQLGDGTTDDRTTPVQVNAPVQFDQVVAGFFHTCAIGADQKTYCWGQNAYGQLGDGTTTGRSTPVEVVTSETFTSLASMVTGNCALNTDDEAYCWGTSNHGELGIGTNASTTPLPVQ